jgi:hypothetical protein
MLSNIIITALILFPLIIGIYSADGNKFMAAFMISSVTFLMVAGLTNKKTGYDLIPPNQYTVETTPTSHYIYVKNENRVVVSTVVIDKVSEYNLVNSGNFDVKLSKFSAFFFDYTGEYVVHEKEIK